MTHTHNGIIDCLLHPGVNCEVLKFKYVLEWHKICSILWIRLLMK